MPVGPDLHERGRGDFLHTRCQAPAETSAPMTSQLGRIAWKPQCLGRRFAACGFKWKPRPAIHHLTCARGSGFPKAVLSTRSSLLYRNISFLVALGPSSFICSENLVTTCTNLFPSEAEIQASSSLRFSRPSASKTLVRSTNLLRVK